MADPEVSVDPMGDEEMAEVEVIEAETAGDDANPSGLEDIEPTIAERTTFLEYVAHHPPHHAPT